MPEADELKAAQALVAAGMKEKALPLLWKLYGSTDLEIKIYAGLALLVALDQLTQTEKLLEVTDDTLAAAATLERREVRAYLHSKKAEFLAGKLSNLVYQQRNLTLAAGVFEWINFSLEEDKLEFAKLAEERTNLENEISSLEREVWVAIESTDDQYTRGHVYASLGEVSFTQYLSRRLAFAGGGRLRSRIMNSYWVRRWHLDNMIGYSGKARREIIALKDKCVALYRKAIKEFEAGPYKGDQAFALYRLAVKFEITYRFSLARRYLRKAKRLAEAENESSLLSAIKEVETALKDKNRHPRNYVEELGLDLPRALRKR